jgi:hypothetical protein
VRNAQDANFSAAIIYNVKSEKLIPMGGDDETLIPSVFIGYSDGGKNYCKSLKLSHSISNGG